MCMGKVKSRRSCLCLPAAIRIRLGVERFFADGADQGLVVGRDDDDPCFGHRMAAPGLDGVEANECAARNEHVAVDNGPPEARMAADTNTRHENGLLDLAEAVDPNIG